MSERSKGVGGASTCCKPKSGVGTKLTIPYA